MTKEQINQYFILAQTRSNTEDIAEEIIELIEDIEHRRKFQILLLQGEINEEKTEKHKQEFNGIMLRQIQKSGLYEYFEEIGMQEENQPEFFELILHSTIPVEVEKAKEYLKRFDSTEDKEDKEDKLEIKNGLKESIEDESLESILQEIKKRDNAEYKLKIINATKDTMFIKQCIEDESLEFILQEKSGDKNGKAYKMYHKRRSYYGFGNRQYRYCSKG